MTKEVETVQTETEVREKQEKVNKTSEESTKVVDDNNKEKKSTKNQNTEIKKLEDELITFKSENETLKAQVEEYQNKVSDLETKKQEFEKQRADYVATIQQKDVSLKLAEKGLGEFKEFFSNIEPDKLDEQIQKFQQLVKQKEIDNSYKPTNHKLEDTYTQAKSKGDLKSMFSSLLFNKN
ncbi:hypothetical protein V7149_17365 [Bacillus sp. JJ1503]|uniref:hypothetical protein n=1 Tax=Bacillus sp. JJ1503 TaxID=3122956 RepID=UPI002FFF9AE0